MLFRSVSQSRYPCHLVSQQVKGDKGDKGDRGDKGDQGEAGKNGASTTVTGSQGPKGDQGDPATDDQTISYVNGTQILSISGGNSVDLSGLMDNTDVLASLSCSVGQIVQYNGSVWACISPAASSDSQTLSLIANSLSITNGNSVSLAGYLDNTDSQAISVASNILIYRDWETDRKSVV